MLCFANSDNIFNIYKKIKKKFNNILYSDFFKYYEWKPNCIIRKIKIIPDWNYFNLLNSIENDQKYLYITSNIAELINKILNDKPKTKYPNFDNWEKLFF